MSQFRRYDHVERFGHSEVADIAVGTVHVFPKLDGTNGSVWADMIQHSTLGAVDAEVCVGVKCASRNRTLSLENDNQGFCAWANSDDPRAEALRDYVIANKTLVAYGEWLCLSGDTEIRLASAGKRQGRGSRVGHTMSLREMYQYQETDIEEELNYVKKDGTRSKTMRPSWWKRNGYPQCFSLFQDVDEIRRQRIAKVIYTGIKEVYRVSTRNGFKIKSTAQHKFWTPKGWLALSELEIGDCVATSDLRNKRGGRKHGVGSRKVHVLHRELRESGGCRECGSDDSLEVHHLDQNWRNNQQSNLAVLCTPCHRKAHSYNLDNSSIFYPYEFDKVESIEQVGEEDCYDLSMGAPENSSSFVADGFVVHNCPHTIKTYRDESWRRFWVFDVWDRAAGRYLSWEDYSPALIALGVDVIEPLCIIENPSEEQLQVQVETNTYLIRDGAGLGEGVVIKNYGWSNRYGRQPWSKIVRNEFKEDNRRMFGTTEKGGPYQVEAAIAEQFCTPHLVGKTRAKVVADVANEKGIDLVADPNAQAEVEHQFRHKVIPQLLGRVFHDLVVEECWTFVKKHKNPMINFKLLQAHVTSKVKEYARDLF